MTTIYPVRYLGPRNRDRAALMLTSGVRIVLPSVEVPQDFVPGQVCLAVVTREGMRAPLVTLREVSQ